MERGRIVKVSGPLVQAEGMKESRMYDVVRVGEEQLIGEIIRIEGDIVSIQVYEETEGLKVGDPVIGTGQPLVVELGPGLLSNIFDGIQRPLSMLEKTGDFIIKGTQIPALDREKKWGFKPIVKKGDSVSGGDIIGEVQETGILTHKIMVPPGISGEIIEIKEGNFTVEEEIGRIRTEDKREVPLYLMQRWPVRMKRPVKEKMPPFEPLVTGQRVIDTLFPVLKGGTACIPGPFGSGKCVTGDTPVLYGEGNIKTIEEIYKEAELSGKKVVNGNEEYIILKKPLDVHSFHNGRIEKGCANLVYKGYTDRIVKIYTRSGRVIKVTPVHKLFRFNENMVVEEVPAYLLKEGDYLAAPRVIPSKGRNYHIPVYEIFRQYRSADKKLNSQTVKIIDEMRKEKGSLSRVAKELKISWNVLYEYYKGRNNPSLDFIEKVYARRGKKVPFPEKIKGQSSSIAIKVPSSLDEKLGLFLGLLMADGMLKINSIRFYNNDEKIRTLYSSLATELFGLKTKSTYARTVKCLLLESCVVSGLLKFFGFPEVQKSKNLTLPPALLNSPLNVIASFLKGYFLCDGYFSPEKGEIEITTASGQLASHLSYLLTKLGIVYKVSRKRSGSTIYSRVFIRGKEEIKRFYELTGDEYFEKYALIKAYLYSETKRYQRCDTVHISSSLCEEVYNRCGKPYKILKDAGVEVFNLLAGERITLEKFRTFALITGDEFLNRVAFNCLAHIYQDRIIKIETEEYTQPVYDLQVEKYHNFIGGDIPAIFHNTVVLHMIAKWADSQVVVYIGCGERGNEMADVLIEFPELKDPGTGRPLMERTVLIANTSNMPVAAREASIYTGITIAEYFRDMGYSVALMADSTSRWAEALREISGRLGEMPGEEGYPAYLGTSVASFYERAGRCMCLGNREGTLSVIGAVSPPGGDLTDPVVQMTLKVVKVYWGLDDRLAYQRHFPAINWLTSYSLYEESIRQYLEKEVAPDSHSIRKEALSILEKEAELTEIVRLVGMETLSAQDRLILDTARAIREDFLHQSAFDDRDAYTTLKKQYRMLKAIILFHRYASSAMEKGVSVDKIRHLPVKEGLVKMRYIPHPKVDEEFDRLDAEIKKSFTTS